MRRQYPHHFHDDDDDDHTANELHHNGNGDFRQRIAFNQPHPYSALRVSRIWHRARLLTVPPDQAGCGSTISSGRRFLTRGCSRQFTWRLHPRQR